MKLVPKLTAVLLGTATTIALIQPQPATAALSAIQVNEIAQKVTVLIVGQAPGSGVIIKREGNTYTVLTARHVVATPDEYDIIASDGKRFKLDFKTVKSLPGVDLAVLTFTSDANTRSPSWVMLAPLQVALRCMSLGSRPPQLPLTKAFLTLPKGK
jgi:serine protease Do